MAFNSGSGAAQSKTGTTSEQAGPEGDEIVSKRVMRLIMRDLDDFKLLKLEYSALTSRFDSILISNQKLILDMEIHFAQNLELEMENAKLLEGLKKANLRTAAYKAVASRERQKAQKMKKYQVRAAFKTGEMVIAILAFSAVILGGAALY